MMIYYVVLMQIFMFIIYVESRVGRRRDETGSFECGEYYLDRMRCKYDGAVRREKAHNAAHENAKW